METPLIAGITIINIISIIAFVIIRSDVSRYTKKQLEIVGAENKKMIISKRLKTIRYSYTLIFLAVLIIPYLYLFDYL